MKKNNYSVVNETTSIEYDGDVKVTRIKGYDTKGRVVGVSTYRDYPDGTRGYCCQAVHKDGYWHGAGYDPIINQYVEFAPMRFVEGEIE